jgi:hypothetical protein
MFTILLAGRHQIDFIIYPRPWCEKRDFECYGRFLRTVLGVSSKSVRSLFAGTLIRVISRRVARKHHRSDLSLWSSR